MLYKLCSWKSFIKYAKNQSKFTARTVSLVFLCFEFIDTNYSRDTRNLTSLKVPNILFDIPVFLYHYQIVK
jgi:hypothetical protein